MASMLLTLTLAIHWVSNKYPGSEIDWWLLAFWPMTIVAFLGNTLYLMVGNKDTERYRSVQWDDAITIAVALVGSVVLHL